MLRIFDMDGTVCESRQIISPKMKKKLLALKEPIVVISGAEVKRINKQMDGVPCIKMGQNGNEAPDWKNKLNPSEKKEVLNHVKLFAYSLNDLADRGCQMSYSFTGHNADLKYKVNFDPDKKIRQWVLKQFPFKSKTLSVRIAGTTCFDYNRKNTLKGDNLRRYIKLHKLKKKDCVYYGDALFKGGNDESVKGVMKCIAVKNPSDLLKKL